MKNKKNARGIPPLPGSNARPKHPYVSAVFALAKQMDGDLSVTFDKFGEVRTITTGRQQGLFGQGLQSWQGNPIPYASRFLNNGKVVNALGLRHVELGAPLVSEDPQLGYSVVYPQQVTIDGVTFPVRHGFVDVHMNRDGEIFTLNSTLRRGRRNIDVDKIMPRDAAIQIAKQAMGSDLEFDNEDSWSCELMLSAHNGRMDPVYEIVAQANNPRQVERLLVKAQTGEVVHRENILRTSFWGDGSHLPPLADVAKGKRPTRAPKQRVGKPATGSPVMGKAFLRIPNPKVNINTQVHDVVLESLPDPKVLRNQNFIMYAGNSRTPLQARPDGTFKFNVDTPEFATVVSFFALNAQMELMKKWGLKAPKKPIPVWVHDRSVPDNAYFDPSVLEIHIGVGTGTRRGGLAVYLAYDIGVAWHENGHHLVFLQTPGKDLPGRQGGALHESTGDMQALVMNWMFQHTFATQLGAAFDSSGVNADPRIIGSFAAPPNGIRKLLNNKRSPRDERGQVHSDGEISGGAKSDLCVALANQYGVPDGLEIFMRMMLAALAIVPPHRVGFTDMLNAFITADQRLNNGAHKEEIIKAFGNHGIRVSTAKPGGPKQPTIIVID